MDLLHKSLDALKSTGKVVFDLLVIKPLRNLYFEGPTILGIGFWEKLPHKDICSRLTGVSATFWDKNEASRECKELLTRIVGLFTLAYVWGTYKILSFLLFRLLVLRPITLEIKEELKKVLLATCKDKMKRRRSARLRCYENVKEKEERGNEEHEEEDKNKMDKTL
mgnify:CR=1 FL=1